MQNKAKKVAEARKNAEAQKAKKKAKKKKQGANAETDPQASWAPRMWGSDRRERQMRELFRYRLYEFVEFSDVGRCSAPLPSRRPGGPSYVQKPHPDVVFTALRNHKKNKNITTKRAEHNS